MSGSIQSSNYVPGVSGWKFDPLTGDLEMNSARTSQSTEPQMITVTAGEWSEYDLPANGIKRYAFIGEELANIPAEHRDNAEFTTKDFSLDCDGSDVRTTLTYDRLETQREVADRLEKAKVAGTRIVKAGGCTTIICDGVVRARFGNLDASLPSPFVVADGKVYLRDDLVKEASIAKAKVASEWSVRVELSPTGQPYAAGFGIGIGMAGELKPDIIVKASHMEILPDGLVKITQAPK